ncbi:MAG TPA: matrixin family metalloprotease [Polyangiaceae bacterium LLY-WYZ-14_1]|nr:matrixin family metalloprotease [Polyangiaceae bacterium LLY-WYZ-14_1]
MTRRCLLRRDPSPGLRTGVGFVAGVAAVAASVGGVALGRPGMATAWSGIGSTWADGNPAYAIQEDGSDDLGSASVAQTREGMDAWTVPACTGFRLRYEGLTGTAPGTYEGENVVGWVESDWPRGSGVLGVTSTRFTGSGIVEADISLNGEDWTWVTGDGSTRDRTCNAFSIIAHEAGHFAGLGHSSDGEAIMRASYPGGSLTLGDDDEEGICSLYPAPEPPPSCDETGCPAGQDCIDDVCRTPLEVLCQPCDEAADCGGPDDACLIYPDMVRGCAIACRDDADCGDGGEYACLSVRGADRSQCVRRIDGVEACPEAPPMEDGDDPVPPNEEDDEPNDPGEGAAPLGDGCFDGSDCASGVCVDAGDGGFCSQACGDGSCPAGFTCVASGGIDFCRPVGEGDGTGEPAPPGAGADPLEDLEAGEPSGQAPSPLRGGCRIDPGDGPRAGPRLGRWAFPGLLLLMGVLRWTTRRRRRLVPAAILPPCRRPLRMTRPPSSTPGA